VPLNPEAILQKEHAGYLRSHLRPPQYFSAIGHGSRGGGQAGFLRGVLAKGMGVKRDLPDLYFRRPHHSWALSGATWPTFWVELKVPGRPVPPSQLEMHEVLRSWGDQVAVSRSLEQTIAQLREWSFDLSEEKLSTERIRRGFDAEHQAAIASYPFGEPGPLQYPESDNLGRKRRAKT
jgi:hypothetical protein